jgi:hypothetical protein
MVKGLDFFSKCAIADNGTAEDVEAELELPPVPDEPEED